jgi:hypothetical protein
MPPPKKLFLKPGSSSPDSKVFLGATAAGVLAVLVAILIHTGGSVATSQKSATAPVALIKSHAANHDRLLDHANKKSSSPAPARQLEESIRLVLTETDPSAREKEFRNLLTRIPTSDIPGALEKLRTAPPNEITDDLTLRLVRRWAENDPQSASEWATQISAGAARGDALDQVAIAWTNQELEAAVEWARQLPKMEERQKTLGAIAQEAVRTDPVAALQLAVKLPSDATRDGVILHATSEWATTDASSAVAWAHEIPDETLRGQALAAAATAWGDGDPVAAAKLAATELPPGRLQADTVVSIVQRWAQQDPEQAAAWVRSFPEGELRKTASESLEINSPRQAGR